MANLDLITSEELIAELRRRYQDGPCWWCGRRERAMDTVKEQLVKALKDATADLFCQIENKHGPRAASQYPSVMAARSALRAAEIERLQRAAAEQSAPAPAEWWQCTNCGAAFAEYVNGCPKCNKGSVRLLQHALEENT